MYLHRIDFSSSAQGMCGKYEARICQMSLLVSLCSFVHLLALFKGAIYKINSPLVVAVQYQLLHQNKTSCQPHLPFPITVHLPHPVLSNSTQCQRHVCFERNFRLCHTKNVTENYTILNKRINTMHQITTLVTRQVLLLLLLLFFNVITTCKEEFEPLVGIFLPLCVVRT